MNFNPDLLDSISIGFVVLVVVKIYLGIQKINSVVVFNDTRFIYKYIP